MAAKIETAKNRFLIRRRDMDNAVDDVVIESEGLTIGRLVSNDLVLNHRAVSRTHAGIKEIRGEFWLFNLSQSNGTVLNGELVEKTALRNTELAAVERHLDRLREGRPETIETTSLHLDVLRDLRRIHSHICSVAYPVLDAAGEPYRRPEVEAAALPASGAASALPR